MHDLEGIFVPVSMFGAIFGICYLYFTTRNRERMALIEKGIDASILFKKNKIDYSRWTLKLGLLAIGVAFGIVLGVIASNVFYSAFYIQHPASGQNWEWFENRSAEIIVPLAFLFGGVGLLISYFIERKHIEKKKED